MIRVQITVNVNGMEFSYDQEQLTVPRDDNMVLYEKAQSMLADANYKVRKALESQK